MGYSDANICNGQPKQTLLHNQKTKVPVATPLVQKSGKQWLCIPFTDTTVSCTYLTGGAVLLCDADKQRHEMQ